MLLLFTTVSEEAKDSELLDKLISQTAAGDGDAFEKLYRLTKASVYGYAMSILKHPQDAEDVLHDCFVRLYHAAGGYASRGKPMAWILTIAKNLCYKRLNDRSRSVQLDDDEWETAFETNELMGREEIMTSRRLTELLSEDERSIVILHAVSLFKYREIGEFMDLPTSTVISKYHRAINKLRRAYFEDENIKERMEI